MAKMDQYKTFRIDGETYYVELINFDFGEVWKVLEDDGQSFMSECSYNGISFTEAIEIADMMNGNTKISTLVYA